MKQGIILLALGIVFAPSAKAQKSPVYVSCSIAPNDFVGPRLCSALRDAIARSPRYREVGFTAPHYGIFLVSNVILDGTLGLAAQSITLTSGSQEFETFLNNYVLVTPRLTEKEQAETILALLDQNKIRH
jgi:hypothetical protein